MTTFKSKLPTIQRSRSFEHSEIRTTNNYNGQGRSQIKQIKQIYDEYFSVHELSELNECNDQDRSTTAYNKQQLFCSQIKQIYDEYFSVHRLSILNRWQ